MWRCIWIFLLIKCCFFGPVAVWSLTCLDDNGQAVDWFAALKLPRGIEGADDSDNKYFLFTKGATAWQSSKYTVDGDGGAIYKTIMQAYKLKKKNSTVTLIYNDETPTSKSLSYGHLKGVLAFDTNGMGFWVIDSVPGFPGETDYVYPDKGLKFGQHFLCVTFTAEFLPTIVNQLAVAHPHVYVSNVPDWIGTKYPNLAALANNKRVKLQSDTSLAKLLSVKGQLFLHFSKSSEFGKDLYDSFVAPGLKSSLYFEGWVDGAGDLPSSCGPYRVYNIEEVQLENFSWTTSHDHSKWAVSADKTKQWVCLGDINRQTSQAKRGGGTMCLVDSHLWSAFSALVSKFEHCTSTSGLRGFRPVQL